MDLFAHITSGMLAGRIFKPEGDQWKKFVLFGGVAGILPDLIDMPIAIMGHDAWYSYHQIFTHSLFGLIFIPLISALIPLKFAPFKTRYFIALAGWTVHILLDLSARWPVPLFLPISDKRWTFYLIRNDFSWIIDMMFVTGFLLTILDPLVKYGRRIAIFVFVFIAAWLFSGLPN